MRRAWTLLTMTLTVGGMLSCTPPSAGDDDDSGSTGCGTAPGWTCLQGTVGGPCGDGAVGPQCVGSQWQCPDGTVRSDQCACVGNRPGCTCAASGWVCADGGAGLDGGNPDSGPKCNAATVFSCVSGTPGGSCGDAVQGAVCVGSQWQCPDNTIPVDQCACMGRPAGNCTCESHGWVCTDGGAACDPLTAFSCVSGTAGGECGDAFDFSECVAGAWQCPANTIPVDLCACVGRPAGTCTCGSSGWVCPDGGASCDPDAGFTCVSGTAGGLCGDGLEAAECVGSTWQCPADTIPVDLCACMGMPPGACTCTTGGWVCADAGAPCEPAGVFSCVGGTPGGACGDGLVASECVGGLWQCPANTIPADQCACMGMPPGNCTCGAGGWECVDAGPPVLGLLSVEELAAMLTAKDFLMIDVHIPYAGHIPGTDTSLAYSNVDALAACIGSDLDRKVVLTCWSSGMSASAGNALLSRGYRSVSHLVGGMVAWENAGHTLDHWDGGAPACP